jgi:hypothetical protein
VKCECCGNEIGDIAFDKSYKMPDDIFSLPQGEKDDRAEIDSDLCRLGERYFLRGVAYIPVIETDQSYGWGVWVEVPEENFFDYVQNYENDNSSMPKFKGVVANDIPFYKNTIGLEVEIQLGNETQRPNFTFLGYEHELANEQLNGINIQKVHSFSATES